MPSVVHARHSLDLAIRIEANDGWHTVEILLAEYGEPDVKIPVGLDGRMPAGRGAVGKALGVFQAGPVDECLNRRFQRLRCVAFARVRLESSPARLVVFEDAQKLEGSPWG